MTSRATSVARHSVIAGALVVGMMLCMTCRKPNRAPSMPDAPDGPSSGAKDSLCEFTSEATDPDGDGLCFRFDWGDGDTSDWTGWVGSGQPGGMSHAWHRSGNYAVRTQAKDHGDSMSAWSEAHQLSVAISWRKTFGRSNGDKGSSVEQTSDGGYIVTGLTTQPAGDGDAWLLKVDSTGEKTWDVTIGGAASDAGNSVQQTADGGYIVVGYTFSYGAGSRDAWLIKTDAVGNKVWDRTYGGSAEESGQSVAQTPDGGYIIAGKTCSFGAGAEDVWLIKTDGDGDTLWTRTFGVAGSDEGMSVQPTSDGGYIVGGYTISPATNDQSYWLIKTDSVGNKIWDRIYEGADGGVCASVQQTSDHGYIMAGPTFYYAWLVKTDSVGNKVWDKTYGASTAVSVRQTSDGGYVFAGTYRDDAWLVRTDAAGNKAWDKTFGGGSLDQASSVRQTLDGGYIVVGYAYSFSRQACVYLIKTDANGH
jgi:hypothetical protein